jgi:sulfonate transport system substrate-binding protein
MKLRNLVLLGTATAALALSACGTSTSVTPAAAPVPSAVDTAQLANVTLRIGDQKGSSEQVLLRAAGLLGSVPYRVQWSTFTSGPPMLEAANDNAIDVGQVGNTPPIFSAAANGRIDIVAALRSSVGDGLLVPKNSTIHSLADLRGKTIAVAKGSSANGTLLNTLTKAGLKPTDVHITYLQPADAYAAFSQGSVAAWAIWEPYDSEAVHNLGARELVTGTDALRGAGLAGGTPLSNGLTFQVANRAALTDAGKNAAIKDYVARIVKADQWARTHLSQWTTLYAQQTGIPKEIAAVAVPRIVLTPIVIDDSVVAAEQKLADAFSTAGQLPGKVDMKSFIDSRYNDTLRPLIGTN